MKQFRLNPQIGLLFLVLSIFLFSCRDEKKAPPFPVYENEYEQPVTKSFELSQSDTLHWTSKKLPSSASLPTKKFNWDKLPSKPFDIGIPYAVHESRPDKPINWDSLPVRGFDLDSLPKQDLKIKVTVLGAPKIVRAGFPEVATAASRGVMSLDEDFGYPGTIYYHMKDKDEMMWFGGSSGLARYDGENLELYGQEQGLRSNIILMVFQDSKERIWAADNSGVISIIDVGSKLIYELSSTIDKGDSYGMLETNDGKFWIPKVGIGYNILDLEERSVRQFTTDHGMLDPVSIEPFQDKEGLIWLPTGKGVNILDLKAGKNISLTNDAGLLGEFIVSFYEDQSNNIWISSDNGINILNGAKNNISYLSDPFKFGKLVATTGIYETKEGDFWIGTDIGLLYHYMPSLGSMERYTIKISESNFPIFGITEDEDGQVWMSTYGEGVFVVNRTGGRPGNFTNDDGLQSMPIWSVLQTEDGKYWFGGTVGIDIYDSKNGSVQHLNVKDGLATELNTRIIQDSKGRIWSFGVRTGVSIVDPEKETIAQFANRESLDGNSISAILEDSDGNFWLGGHLGKLFFMDVKNDLFKEVIIDTIGEENYIDNIIEDDKKQIWIAGRGMGIHILDSTHQYRKKLGVEEGLVSEDVYTLMKDDDNVFWTGTARGLERINLQEKRISTFAMNQGLAANEVWTIIKRQDKILLGTTNGLTILDPVEEEVQDEPIWNVSTLSKRQGLEYLDFHMNSFFVDNEERLWAGVERQILTVIDEIPEDTNATAPYITAINIFDKKQSFNDLELIGKSLSNEDSIWSWESNDYVLKSKDEILSKNMNQRDIEWTSIAGPYDIPQELSLPFDQNYVSFTFTSGRYANPEKMIYRYILEGIDKNWSFITDKTTSENYRDLPPGDYNFMVASKGFNGVWSDPAELKFTILPPWWQTWWAYTIFIALFLGLGLVILHYRSRWLKNENKILEDRVNERTSELKKTISELENTQSQLIQSEKMASLGELTAGIAHEIQNPMNFINNFSEVTIELVDEMCEELDKGEVAEAKDISIDIIQNLGKITHHGKRASSIVKGMLEHSRNSSGQKEMIDLNVLSDEYLRLAYHGLRAKDKSFNADFKTDFDETLPKVEIIPQDLGRVVLNIINNAFFAVTSIPENERDENYKPTVTVSTKNLKTQARISIKDNGPGIPAEIKDKIFQPFFTTKPTGKGTGLGLSLAYDIVTTGHGGAIELNTEPGTGTEFVIYIPIKNK